MSDSMERPVEQRGISPDSAPVASARTANWKPILTLLVISPAIGELLSGSSPPLQFFNPVFFLLLVGLYGCGALLVRETVVRHHLDTTGVLLLGAAYGIVEEGLTCKSFFNPNWTDTGFLSVYGRAWGVNWVWAFGLTFYHMVVSIAVPIFLTEAIFASRAREPWLRRRGWVFAGTSLALVTLLGFLGFDNRQFHLIEVKQPLALASELADATNVLDRFISNQLNAKNRAVVRKAVVSQADSPELRHALQDELNRLLPRSDLYTPERFAGVVLPEELKQQTKTLPRGDQLVIFNRALLERAFPAMLATRQVYPFRPDWGLTFGCLLAITGLVMLALKQTRAPEPGLTLRKPWLTGLAFTAAFFAIGFVLPSLVEHGAKISAVITCLIWWAVAAILARILGRMDASVDRLSRRGLWAIGVITPWVFFALLLGIFVGMIGAKSLSGMPFVALAFGAAILKLARQWGRRLRAAGQQN
jgi:hypothetical protein